MTRADYDLNAASLACKKVCILHVCSVSSMIRDFDKTDAHALGVEQQDIE